jgi:GDP-L-fucose synthase
MSSRLEGKRVLVTGGGGFLGSHVGERLRELNCKSIFIVRSREFDLTNEDEVKQLYQQHPADVVVHLAGLVGGIGPNKQYPATFFHQNIMMGVLTMHHAWKSGAERFVCAGAGCGYPEHAPLPLKEESFWSGFPQKESYAYSLAKRMLHVQSMAYWAEYKFPSVVTIPGNIYGPYDNFDLENAHVIPALVRKFVEATEHDNGRGREIVIWGSGKATRDFVYAGDVADGMMKAVEKYDGSELVNLSSGREHSVREVVDALVAITKFEGKIVWDTSRPEGQSRRLFDISKAQRELGYEASTSLYDGLKLTADWYRRNRSQARNTVEVTSAVAAV